MSIENDVEEYLADISQFPDWQGAVWKIRRQLIELGRVADEQQRRNRAAQAGSGHALSRPASVNRAFTRPALTGRGPTARIEAWPTPTA